MTREEKTVIIDELVEKINGSATFYIADASGMTVEQTNKFRKMCFDRGVEYKVYKNTLVKKALERISSEHETFSSQVLKGFSGLLFSNDAKVPALLLKDFTKGKEKPFLKGAIIERSAAYIGTDQLDALTKIKSKNELIGDVIGLLQSPAKNVISALTGSSGKLAGLVKALAERNQ